MHGLFAINLGVYVPEVARSHGGGEAKSWIQDYHCCVRMRLGQLIGEGKDMWWHADESDAVANDVLTALKENGLPFLGRFSTRDRILAELQGISINTSGGSPPRIVSAIILCQRGELDQARKLLRVQALETKAPGHPAYVRTLAKNLGLGDLDG
jgi:hypothetical protein